MSTDGLQHIALLLLEALVVSGFLLAFFRLRNRFGLSLLCVTLGTFQYLQTHLAASLYLEVWQGIFVSPGSAVLFTATIFTTLLIYIRDDAVAARSLIVGIVAANITLTVVLLLTQQQVAASSTVVDASAQNAFFIGNIPSLLSGTLLLCFDVILIIVLYEFFFRVFPRSLFARVVSAMVCVVTVDTVAFVTLNFYGEPALSTILVSGLVGKVAMAIVYSIVMVIYLKRFSTADETVGSADQIHDIFHILTYRQRYELLKDELSRDSMTGLFNRGFFDANLPQEMERATRLEHNLNLMLVDLDNFKSINDQYGHQTGDQVIKLLADAMRELFRAADIPCRYGGEEFAIILPDSSEKAAYDSAQRLARLLRKKCLAANLPVPATSVSFTAGIASYPPEATSAAALLKLADDRLYEGKRSGRNRVIDGRSSSVAAAA